MDLTISICLFAGLASFLSPCVLPIIPGYISYISGSSLDNIKVGNKSTILLKTLFFSLGFSFVFIILGFAASAIGKVFLYYSGTFRFIAGIIIIFFSFHLMGLINFKFMNKNLNIQLNEYKNNILFSFIIGIAFGFGWTPCIGPILGSILTMTAVEENFYRSFILLSSYSLGLAIPFILSGLLIEKFLLFSKSIKKHLSKINKLMGIILFITGLAILTNKLQVLGFYIFENIPFLNNFS